LILLFIQHFGQVGRLGRFAWALRALSGPLRSVQGACGAFKVQSSKPLCGVQSAFGAFKVQGSKPLRALSVVGYLLFGFPFFLITINR
jgi:hypothetical protein